MYAMASNHVILFFPFSHLSSHIIFLSIFLHSMNFHKIYQNKPNKLRKNLVKHMLKIIMLSKILPTKSKFDS